MVRRVPVPPGGFRRIAVLRLSSLGDVVLTLPVVRGLARAFPGAHIAYWTKAEYRDLARFDPAVDHVRALEPDARRLEDLVSMSAELEDRDLIVDLHANPRTRLLALRQKAPVLRAPSYRLLRERWVRARWTRPAPPPSARERFAAALAPIRVKVEGEPRVEAGAEAERWAEEWMAAWAPGQPPVAICPGARHFTKRWPEAHWVDLCGRISGAGRPVLILSTEDERAGLPALAALAERDAATRWWVGALSRTAALFSRCVAAVTGDTGLMHLAAARGLRVVALFGSTVPELGFAPAGSGHAVLCRREPCQPCTLHGRPACPKRHFRCMLGIRPEDVTASLAALGPP